MTVTTWPTPRRPGRKRINVAARGPGPGDLERVRSVFGLLDNPWPALQIWEYLGLSWGKGNVSEFRRARGAAGPLSPSRPGNQMKPQVKSYFILFFFLQAQQQRNLDNIVSQQPRISGGKKSKKEFSASSELEVKNTSPMSEQDSGILDVEDEDEEEEVTATPDRGHWALWGGRVLLLAHPEGAEEVGEHPKILLFCVFIPIPIAMLSREAKD